MSRPLLPVPWVIALALFLIVMGLAHLGAVIRYSVPNAEDFALSVAPREVGAVTSAVELLSFMDSRYTTNLLQGFNVLTLGLYRQFWVMPALTLSALWLTMAFFFGSLFNPKGLLQVPLAAAVLTVAFYAITPSLGFSLTYMSSTFTYMWPFVLWFLWTGCLLRSFASEGLRHVAFTALGLVCLILSYGCSELFILLNPMTLGMIALVAPRGVRRHVPDLAPYALVSLAALLFILNCPSNKFIGENLYADNTSRYPGTHFTLHSLVVFSKCLAGAMIQPLVLLTMLVIAHLLSSDSLRPSVRIAGSGLLAKLGLWLLMAYIVTWGYYLPRGSVHEFPSYIINVVMMVSLIGLAVVMALARPAAMVPVRHRKSDSLYRGVMTLLAVMTACMPGNNYRLIRTELGSSILAATYTRHLEFYAEVEDVLANDLRPAKVEFALNGEIPSSIFPERDLLPNRENEDWNIAYEMYFGVDEVRMAGDTVFKR
jgi:hypothetical protein